MRGGKSLRSARVSRTLTQEEIDQLDRSTKKAKSNTSQDTVVEETQLAKPMDVEVARKEVLPTTIGDWGEFAKETYWESSGEDEGEDDALSEESEENEAPMECSDDEVSYRRGRSRKVKSDPLCPVIHVTKLEIRDACQPWKRAILVKLLGKRLRMRFLRQRLLKMWLPEGSLKMIDLENDYFFIRFSNLQDVSRVFEGGPWMILDHYLTVRKWHPKFFPAQDDFKRVAVWIRIPGLPIEDDEFMTDRAMFAGNCVEVDLRNVLVSTFELNNRYYKVEYEGLHLICFHCGRYGHRKERCSLIPNSGVGAVSHDAPANEVVVFDGQSEQVRTETVNSRGLVEDGEPEIFGNWMIAQRKSRRNQSNPRRVGGNQGNMNNGKRQGDLHRNQGTMFWGDQPQETCLPDLQGTIIDKSLGASQVQMDQHVPSTVIRNDYPKARWDLTCCFPKLSREAFEFIQASPSDPEIRDSVFDMGPLKAPRPDGLHSIFLSISLGLGRAFGV
ncbi:Zinc finger, CCHC-type [Sesbania bispinosa]|nr:Zinc finger, CCHC-type [Sesbania bispinosa]